jgi:hypothetical protein
VYPSGCTSLPQWAQMNPLSFFVNLRVSMTVLVFFRFAYYTILQREKQHRTHNPVFLRHNRDGKNIFRMERWIML